MGAWFSSPTASGSNGLTLLHSQHCVGTDGPGKDEELSPSSDPALLCARPWGPAHSRANPGTAALPAGWKSAATGDAGRPSTTFPTPAPPPPAETGLCARPPAGRCFQAWNLQGPLCCRSRWQAAPAVPLWLQAQKPERVSGTKIPALAELCSFQGLRVWVFYWKKILG